MSISINYLLRHSLLCDMTPPPQLLEHVVHGCHRPHAALATRRRFVRASGFIRSIFGRSTGFSITAFTTVLLSASAGIEMGVTVAIRFVGIVAAAVVTDKSVCCCSLASSFCPDTGSVVDASVGGNGRSMSFSESILSLITFDCWKTSFCIDFCLFGVSE